MVEHQVRITSGTLRGRPLTTPGGKTHPMGAREKLALFNILTTVLSGATVLDVYAGSGALGLEAISRGAKHATFIESNPKAAAAIRQNIASLELEEQTTVIPTTFSQFVKQNTLSDATAGPQSDSYTIIVADPPYDYFDPSEAQKLALFLAPGGILALSHPGTPDGTPLSIPGCQLLSTRSYAAANISIFQKS